MSKSHVVITGTGRAGTTFLVQLLTHLGLDTGFDAANLTLYPMARAGLELDIRSDDAPYIIKNPALSDPASDELAAAGRLEHVIIPVRSFEAAAASRAHVQEATTGSADGKRNKVPGGLWDTNAAQKQSRVLRRKFSQLMEVLVRNDVPMTFLWYPRLARDPAYLYEKLAFLMADIDRSTFDRVFSEVADPELIHQFTEDDR